MKAQARFVSYNNIIGIVRLIHLNGYASTSMLRSVNSNYEYIRRATIALRSAGYIRAEYPDLNRNEVRWLLTEEGAEQAEHVEALFDMMSRIRDTVESEKYHEGVERRLPR